MNANTQNPMKAIERIHGELAWLGQVLELAIFAEEANRTLEEVFNVLNRHPAAIKDCANSVPIHMNWTTLQYNQSEVLRHLSNEQSRLIQELCDAASRINPDNSGGPHHAG